MKTITLQCNHCQQSFGKQIKEYNRQIKKNNNANFYCSLTCVGGANFSNLPKEWYFSEENKKLLEENRKKLPKRNPFNEYLRRVKLRAKQRKSETYKFFDIDKEYLEELWQQQQGKCAWSNIPLTHSPSSNRNSNHTRNINTQASLDRIDSTKGYIKGNVQFVCCALNYAKNNEPDSSIKELISLIRLYS